MWGACAHGISTMTVREAEVRSVRRRAEEPGVELDLDLFMTGVELLGGVAIDCGDPGLHFCPAILAYTIPRGVIAPPASGSGSGSRPGSGSGSGSRSI